MTRKHILALIILLFLLAACGGKSAASEPNGLTAGGFGASEAEAPAREGYDIAEDAIYYDSGTDGTVANTTQTSFNPAQQTETQERLIIRTGNIDIVVKDTETSLAEIGRLAEQLNGWIVTSEIRQVGDESKSGSITLRIPAEEYDEIVNRVKEVALEVTWESSSSQDVTDEFVDLTSQLGNLEATADRVRAFLNDAETVEEALDVNQELSRLEGEIEVIKGRMQYLSQSAAYSTLTVNLTPDTISQPIEVAGWRPEGTAKNAIETLVKTLQTVADIAIVVGLYFIPLALLFGIPAYIIFRIGRNWYRSRTTDTTVEASD
ncbi:MAG: DUF4349 domain-containing protein [Candidatus Promineifilaceae bacterium]